ncbi:cell envelope integrity protein TolA [Thiomicrorhabdus sediminis]|uniref:Cell envelope integrity protein TolA n=1 Tax=Thiomicrorhabdus sediminis TaxID=2580412 RepID=A0A4P9K7E9_9GAMM|nr:cell envelope integrity protein TolA [Thiomicrorhabdus sediminis]QCU90390.1 cell envelope integrity protein TolA [Thiomicrorhabdus sediminis]
MLKFIKKHPKAFSLALMLHLSILLAFSMQWEQDSAVKIQLSAEQDNNDQTTNQVALAEPMQTFTVDAALVQSQLDKLKAQQQARLDEQKRLQQQTETERQRLKELEKQKVQERKAAEKAKQEAAEQKRKAQAEQKKIEEAKRLAALEKKKADEAKRLADEQKRKAELAAKQAKEAEKKQLEAKKQAQLAEKQRLAEEQKKQELEKQLAAKEEEKKALEKAAEQARQQKEREQAAAELQRQLEAEASAQRAEQKRQQLLSLRETYISSITAKVKENWRTPARISEQAQCDLKITQSPNGNITSVKVLNCNKFANDQFKDAAEKAVYRAEPLPQPPTKELFERVITFEFKP